MKFEEAVTEEVFAAAVAKVCGQDVAEKFLKNCLKSRYRAVTYHNFRGWFVWYETDEGHNYWLEQALKFEAAPQEETKAPAGYRFATEADKGAVYLKNWKVWSFGQLEAINENLIGCNLRWPLPEHVFIAIPLNSETPPTANVDVAPLTEDRDRLATDRTLLEIAKDWLRKEDARTLDERARVKADEMRAALEGSTLMSVATKPEPDLDEMDEKLQDFKNGPLTEGRFLAALHHLEAAETFLKAARKVYPKNT